MVEVLVRDLMTRQRRQCWKIALAGAVAYILVVTALKVVVVYGGIEKDTVASKILHVLDAPINGPLGSHRVQERFWPLLRSIDGLGWHAAVTLSTSAMRATFGGPFYFLLFWFVCLGFRRFRGRRLRGLDAS